MAQKVKLAPNVPSFTANNGNFVVTKGMVIELSDDQFQALFTKYSQRFQVTTDNATHAYDGTTVKEVAPIPTAKTK